MKIDDMKHGTNFCPSWDTTARNYTDILCIQILCCQLLIYSKSYFVFLMTIASSIFFRSSLNSLNSYLHKFTYILHMFSANLNQIDTIMKYGSREYLIWHLGVQRKIPIWLGYVEGILHKLVFAK